MPNMHSGTLKETVNCNKARKFPKLCVKHDYMYMQLAELRFPMRKIILNT